MLRVCVIFGGASSEYEVSLRSAACILENIDRSKYEVSMIGITKRGRWLYYTGPVEMVANGDWETSPYTEDALISPDPTAGGILLLGKKPLPSAVLRRKIAGGNGETLEEEKPTLRIVPVDLVFPVLHGKNGEDGTIQGLFELAQIPYVGCGVLSSAICMDKEIAHIVLERAGVPKTKLVAVGKNNLINFPDTAELLEKEIGYPMFVKPANAGSSVGITKVKSSDELLPAIKFALEHDHKVVVEQAVVGREIECAVWGNENPNPSHSLGEIVPDREFYDYAGKYTDDSVKLIAPAELDLAVVEKVRRIAAVAYRAMECRGLARIDFFVREDGSVVLNEINTLPGFTSISMFPRLFQEDGVTIPKLIDNLIYCALEK